MHLAGVDMKYQRDAEAEKYDESFYHFLRGRTKSPERIYINATADFAPEVMRHIVNEIVDNPEQFPGIYAGKLQALVGFPTEQKTLSSTPQIPGPQSCPTRCSRPTPERSL